MYPTLHDVCRQAGVSTATVSRVSNQSPLVTEQTRARVLEAMRSLGYRPSHAARTLARQRTELLGVVFPEIASGFFTEVLSGIDQVAARHNFHLMTAFSHGLEDEEQFVTRLLLERRVDALILMNLLLSDDFIKRAAQYGTPIALIDRPVDGSDLFAVSMDNEGGAQIAMNHLLGHGYRKLAIITGPTENYDAQQRLEGCKKAVQRAGLAPADFQTWPGGFNEASGRAAVHEWLANDRSLPQAIFAANDAMAFGALSALREKGIRVPHDIALIGFDDSEAARHLQLTSVRVPMREMGGVAAEVAIQQISSRQPQARRMLPTSLVVRRSCGCHNSETNYNRGDSL
jgi:LacI family transcriptional regulator